MESKDGRFGNTVCSVSLAVSFVAVVGGIGGQLSSARSCAPVSPPPPIPSCHGPLAINPKTHSFHYWGYVSDPTLRLSAPGAYCLACGSTSTTTEGDSK